MTVIRGLITDISVTKSRMGGLIIQQHTTTGHSVTPVVVPNHLVNEFVQAVQKESNPDSALKGAENRCLIHGE
jgi:hypothetical protein